MKIKLPKEKVCVHTPTKNKFIKLQQILINNGCRWKGRESFIPLSLYKHSQCIIITNKVLTYGGPETMAENINIIISTEKFYKKYKIKEKTVVRKLII